MTLKEEGQSAQEMVDRSLIIILNMLILRYDGTKQSAGERCSAEAAFTVSPEGKAIIAETIQTEKFKKVANKGLISKIIEVKVEEEEVLKLISIKRTKLIQNGKELILNVEYDKEILDLDSDMIFEINQDMFHLFAKSVLDDSHINADWIFEDLYYQKNLTIAEIDPQSEALNL